MLDIHSHILPGIDDGAMDDAMSFEMFKAAHKAGVDRIVATPHVSNSNKVARIQSTFDRLQYVAQEHGITLVQGCELSVGVLAGIQITSQFLAPFAIGKTKFVLLEFSDDVPPADWEYLISDIRRVGFRAIIAHPERYRYIAKDISIAQELLNYGCELQLDALSFVSGRFSAERRTAMKLLKYGFISYFASDAHSAKDYLLFSAVRRQIGQNWPADGSLEQLI